MSLKCTRNGASRLNRPSRLSNTARDVIRRSSERLRDRLKIQLHNAGIDLDRVDLEWKIPVNHLEIYSRIDIILDVFPWPSGTTVYESLWMGVPMPSAPNIGTGSNASASCLHRVCIVSASCLHHVGCPDLIANGNNHYKIATERTGQQLCGLYSRVLRRTG